jgi:DNA modification methylase
MMNIERIAIGTLKPSRRNARVHSAKQVRQIANSIKAFGFLVPVLVDEDESILAGNGRYAAAKLLGVEEIPIIRVAGLSAAKKRALAIADNRIAENAGWDRHILVAELPELAKLLVPEDLDVSITGFEPAEIDQIVLDLEEDSADPADEFDICDGLGVSKPGDLWELGSHRILCGDSRDPDALNALLGQGRATMAFLDPPYNVRVKDIVGRGTIKHDEFAMASGELSFGEFVSFLRTTLGAAASVSNPGAIHYVCMDWRHLAELFEAGRAVYGSALNLAVWVKSNAGQGSFYRSQHELIGVFRVGNEAHLNNIELGRHGRHRSNVWRYAGVNVFKAGRIEELQWHPTVKPVAMVCDAIKDCTRRGDIVLDIFGGSGTTLLAAERVGRRGFLIEIEPRFVDVAIRRWQTFTRKDALHAGSNRTFDELAAACG